MGIPRRDGGGGTFQVNIRPLIKTTAEEAGIGELSLPNGTRIVAMGLPLWPNHDRGLHTAFRKFLVDRRPEVVILMGGILNEEAFKQVVDSQDRMRRLIGCAERPEICRIRNEYEGMEDRFLALAKLGGEFIADFAAASGGHVFYIPAGQSAAGQLPNELGLFDFVLAQKEKMDNWAERHPDEAIEGPPIPRDFGEFLQLAEHPHVTVMPFGSAIRVNGSIRFIVGDYRRRNPGSASYVDVEHTGESVVRAFDGKVSSAWWTTPKHSLGDSHRRWWQAHEIGNMFDLKQLGFLRNYDRRGKGIWVGTVAGGKVFGTSIPAITGKDGRRSYAIDGVAYDEDTVTLKQRTIALTLPARTTQADGVTETGAELPVAVDSEPAAESTALPANSDVAGKPAAEEKVSKSRSNGKAKKQGSKRAVKKTSASSKGRGTRGK